MPILHKIKAYLYDNVLTKDNPNDYIARTVSERPLTVQQICEAAVNRGGADVSASAMAHATELFLKEMAYQLCDGYSVNTGYFTASTTIRGYSTALRRLLIRISTASSSSSTRERSSGQRSRVLKSTSWGSLMLPR